MAGRKNEIKNCKNCGIEFSPWWDSDGLYCSNKCQQSFAVKKKIEDWLLGKIDGHTGKTMGIKSFVRKHLHDTLGTACSSCGWDKKHPQDGLTLTEIDHIDGDASNTKLDNLRILCPNCHAMTSTFRNRNKKSARSRSLVE